MLDVRSLVRPDRRPMEQRGHVVAGLEGYPEEQQYEIDADTMFGAGLRMCQFVLEGRAAPGPLAQVANEVRAVPEKGWELAEKSVDDVKTVKDLEARAAALRAAERMFLVTLQMQCPGGVTLHTLRGENPLRWRHTMPAPTPTA